MSIFFNKTFDLTPNHFSLINNWQVEDVRKNGRTVSFIVDQNTRDCYLNEESIIVRTKCILLTIGTPIFHLPGALLNTAYLIFKIVTLRHFFGEAHKNLGRSEQLRDLAHDIARLVLTPLALAGLVISAVYGSVISPFDGRKVYASCERFIYHSSLLAECFQPSREDNYERMKQCHCFTQVPAL